MNWEDLRISLDCTTEQEMWKKLYGQYPSISRLAKHLGISSWTVRRNLMDRGIPINKQGGARRLKIVMTEELIRRLKTAGLAQVARELGVRKYSLIVSRRKYLAAHPELQERLFREEEAKQQEVEQEPPDSSQSCPPSDE